MDDLRLRLDQRVSGQKRGDVLLPRLAGVRDGRDDGLDESAEQIRHLTLRPDTSFEGREGLNEQAANGTLQRRCLIGVGVEQLANASLVGGRQR